MKKFVKFVKFFFFLLSLMMILSMCACGTSGSCQHRYFRDDYRAPSAFENGYQKYTCSECGKSYTETLPANCVNTEDNNIGSGFSKDSRTVRLFDLPLHSKKSSGINPLRYDTGVEDSDGFVHSNCFSLATSSEAFRSNRLIYNLGGKYSLLSGDIYTADEGTAWLEFYDGTDFLYSTARLSEGTSHTSFSFDISGVEYLTVIPVCTDSFSGASWVICDQLAISK